MVIRAALALLGLLDLRRGLGLGVIVLSFERHSYYVAIIGGRRDRVTFGPLLTQAI
jgi:hypothetical protein